jgi:DNA polymerase I
MKRQVLISPQEVQNALTSLNKDIIAFDTETTHLKFAIQQIIGISLCDGTSCYYIDLYESQFLQEIMYCLREFFKNVKTLVAHNAPFDLAILYKYGIPFEHCELFDTQVAVHLIDENNPTGLKYCASTYLGVETKDYDEIIGLGVHSRQFYEYALNDAEWTYNLMLIFRKKLMEEDLVELFRNIEMPFQFVLVQLKTTGLLIDKDRVQKTIEELREHKIKLMKEMYDKLGVNYNIQKTFYGTNTIVGNINFSSPQQLSKILFEDLKLEPVERTDKGYPSVGKKTLQHYSEHDFVSVLNKYKIVDKLLHTFFEPINDYIDYDGRIRPNFNDTGTATGRLSCTAPNVQQLPKVNKILPIDVRGCFICPSGFKMIACDYSSQELRVIAKLSKDENMIEGFKKGMDMHLMTANRVFDLGLGTEELITTHPNYEINKEKYKDERNKAKIVNFGYAYGKGAYGFAKDFGTDEDDAEEFLKKYTDAFPGIEEAREECNMQVDEFGEVTCMSGRKRHFTKIENGDWSGYPRKAYRQAFNFLIQGYSSDMIRMAMNAVYSKFKNYPEFELKAIATVHDEAVYQVREEFAEDAAKMIKGCFENVVSWDFPIEADISIGNSYGEVK